LNHSENSLILKILIQTIKRNIKKTFMNKSIFFPYFIIVSVFIILLGKPLVKAEELVIEPAEPVVAIGQPIQLAVSGLVSHIFWQVESEEMGRIEGSTSRRTTYVAPNKVGQYWVGVMGKDKAGKIRTGATAMVVLSATECQKHPECGNDILNVKAAILIHSSIEEKYIYSLGLQIFKTLKSRFYKDDEIYITPLNFTLKDAFERAKNQSQIAKTEGVSEEPLVVIFIGESLPEKLSELLDDYQEKTGNKVVVIIDAPYSGKWINILKGDQRVIVTSTDETDNNNTGINAFSQFYFDQLGGGANYWDAWELVANRYAYSNDPQKPQLEDNQGGELAQSLRLNNFGALPGPCLDIRLPGNWVVGSEYKGNCEPPDPRSFCEEEMQEIGMIAPFQTVDFNIFNEVNQLQSIDFIEVLVEKADSRQHLLTLRLHQNDENQQWQTSYNAFRTPGIYNITFEIHKNDGNIQKSEPVRLLVAIPSTLTGNILDIPALIALGVEGVFQAKLTKKSGSDSLFELALVDLTIADNAEFFSCARYDANTLSVHIPLLEESGSLNSADLQLVIPPPQADPLLFELKL
jgi:hypothetical protein